MPIEPRSVYGVVGYTVTSICLIPAYVSRDSVHQGKAVVLNSYKAATLDDF